MSIKLAVLVSGRGSNLKAILEAIKGRKLDAKVEAVVSNDPSAAALDIANDFGVPAFGISSRGLSREEHEKQVLAKLKEFRVDYIVLAGYMRLLTSNFLKQYKDPRGFYRIINIHPSLLPAFPGKCAYDDAFNAGVPESGITVHLVDEEMDHGPILAQRSFPRLPDDTLDTFKARGLAVEHELFPFVLQEVACKGLELEGRMRCATTEGGAKES